MPALPHEIWLEIISWLDPVNAWVCVRNLNRTLRTLTEAHFRRIWLPDTVIEVYGKPLLDFHYDQSESGCFSNPYDKACFRWSSDECAGYEQDGSWHPESCIYGLQQKDGARFQVWGQSKHYLVHHNACFRNEYLDKAWKCSTPSSVYIASFKQDRLESRLCLYDNFCLAAAVISLGPGMQIWIDWKKMFSIMFSFHSALTRQIYRQLDDERAALQTSCPYGIGTSFYKFETNLHLLRVLIRDVHYEAYITVREKFFKLIPWVQTSDTMREHLTIRHFLHHVGKHHDQISYAQWLNVDDGRLLHELSKAEKAICSFDPDDPDETCFPIEEYVDGFRLRHPYFRSLVIHMLQREVDEWDIR